MSIDVCDSFSTRIYWISNIFLSIDAIDTNSYFIIHFVFSKMFICIDIVFIKISFVSNSIVCWIFLSVKDYLYSDAMRGDAIGGFFGLNKERTCVNWKTNIRWRRKKAVNGKIKQIQNVFFSRLLSSNCE